MNARVNYPVKRILNALVNDENIDIDDEATKFCVSWVTSRVCQVGSQQVIDAWNNHPIPGKPDSLYSINQPPFLVHILKLLFLPFSYHTAFLNINDAFCDEAKESLYIRILGPYSHLVLGFTSSISQYTFTSIPFASTCMLVNCF